MSNAPIAQPVYAPLSTPIRWLLIAAGTVCVGLGVLGAMLPGLPSTVFFIVAIACYTRSSERLYRWLVSRTWMQKPLAQMANYKRTGALPLRVKVIAMGAAWSSFLLMAFAPTSAPWFVKWIVLALALACSAFMLTRKTATPDP
jgi:hypothetical protein